MSEACRPHIVVIGDVMLDRTIDGTSDRLCPDAPVPVLDAAVTRETPGGAGLAALMCAETAGRVTLVAPIADDDAGRRLVGLLSDRVRVVACGHRGPTRTKTRVRSTGQPIVRIDQGGPASPDTVPGGAIRDAIESADAILVSDYGAGITGHPAIRAALTAAAAPVVWDPHPRGARPTAGTTLATPNLTEARRALSTAPEAGHGLAPAEIARRLAGHWMVRAVAVTAGPAGAFLADQDREVRYIPALPAAGDPCGAGDRFAATVTVALAGRDLLTEAVSRAVAEATGWVAGIGREDPATDPACPPSTGPTATPAASVTDLARTLRTGGRTLVATGGCFDIVHAGHVATLQAARRLGDTLVVLINSDASVRRLKGPQRPIVGQQDRARVLQALDCVDAVVIFDEDDPRRVLDRLRPDVWVKGGDYGGTVLPESDVVAAHGGSTVFVPYLSGHSTSSIIERARTCQAGADHQEINE